MDIDRFDTWAKTLATRPTRRRALGALIGAALGGRLGPAAAAPLGEPALRAGENVRVDVGSVNGLVVDRYTWRDSKGRPRSASLVRYGQTLGGRPRGGYAVQFTYQAVNPTTGRPRTIFIDPPGNRPDAGFGYFVSHERYRTFDARVCPGGGDSCPIAHLHGDDDSPLGHGLPGRGRRVSLTRNQAVHQFALNYPHWGTKDAVAPNATTPSNPAQHQKYDLPVTIRWTFTSGKDYPLWAVTYDLSSVPIDRVSVDMRGPYGVLVFDEADARLTRLEWADPFKFATKGTTVSTESSWAWNRGNTGARYNLLVAGEYEMGLVEAIPYAQSRTGNVWNDLRGTTSADGLGCPDTGWRMPCDWMWTYQSVQYEAFGATPTEAKKLAWGTADYIGSSRTEDDIGEPFDGHPKVTYRVWITFDKSGGANTRRLASSVG